MTEVQLHDLTPADLDELMPIERQVYSHPWTPGNFADALAAGYPGWVLRHQQALVAYCLVMEVPDEIHVLNVSVARAWQGRGLARRLLAHVEHHAKARGCSSVLLEVRVSNQRARQLYASLAYHPIGLRRGYYPSVLGREDAVVMRKLVVAEARDA